MKTRNPMKRGKDTSKEGKEMDLPEGCTCSDCVHSKRCCAIFGHIPEDEVCDWHPSRFRPKEKPVAVNSEFEKLTQEQQDTCLRRGYNPLYRDYSTSEEAMGHVRAVALDSDAKQIDLTGAVKAYMNTLIIEIRKEMDSQ